MNSYQILTAWEGFCRKNPRLIKPIHHAILLHATIVCNKLQWPDEFQYPTDAACQFIGIVDRETFHKGLKQLQTFGAIREVQPAKGLHVARFISFLNCELYLAEKSEGTPVGSSQARTTHSPKPSKPTKEAPVVALPFPGKAFTHQWDRWIQYRKEQGFKTYKETGLKAALSKLQTLAGGNESKAIRIIEESIANGWQGLFELKEKNINPAIAPKPSPPPFIVETR